MLGRFFGRLSNILQRSNTSPKESDGRDTNSPHKDAIRSNHLSYQDDSSRYMEEFIIVPEEEAGEDGTSNSTFAIDWDHEDMEIVKTVVESPEVNKNYNYLNLHLDSPELRHLLPYEDFRDWNVPLVDVYSNKQNEDLLLINTKAICLVDARSNQLLKKFNKREIDQMSVLPNTVSLTKSPERLQKHIEVMLLDRKRFTGLVSYLELFWPNIPRAKF